MVLFDSSLAAVLVSSFAAGIVGYLAAVAAIWGQKRRLYSLECDIADLQDKLLIEIKRRAGTESGKSRKQDQDLLDLALATKNAAPARQPMWWEKYVTHPETRES